MIYYFSGSGNSLWTARALGKELGENVCNMTCRKERELAHFHSASENARVLFWEVKES